MHLKYADVLLVFNAERLVKLHLFSLSRGNIQADFRSPFDATVVSLLRSAGADIVGKLNCDEFGMG
jgi:hypothetical protein